MMAEWLWCSLFPGEIHPVSTGEPSRTASSRSFTSLMVNIIPAEPVVDVPTDKHIIDAPEKEHVFHVPHTVNYFQSAADKKCMSTTPARNEETSAGCSKQVLSKNHVRRFRKRKRDTWLPLLSSTVTAFNRKKNADWHLMIVGEKVAVLHSVGTL